MYIKNLKKVGIVAVSAALIVGQCISSFAYNTNRYLGSTEIHKENGAVGEVHKAGGKVDTFPGWYWRNQYCYYWTDRSTYLKSTTTPDGYAVDDQGRWTVNGVPQTNDYKNQVIGTDALYAGKSDDERWTIMHDSLEKLYAENYYGDEVSLALESVNDMISAGVDLNFGVSHNNILHDTGNGDYIDATLDGFWREQVLKPGTGSNYSYILEKAIKILLGDHVGQELFNDLYNAAEKGISEEGYEVPKLDANGQLIMHQDPVLLTYTVEMERVQNTSDGIDAKYFDQSKWQNRTTDYGKNFSVTLKPHSEGKTTDCHVLIKIQK